jgi:uncharacterized lipoprotein YajG
MKYTLAKAAIRFVAAATAAAILLSGCAANPQQPAVSNPSGAASEASCKPLVAQLQAQLAAEQAERQRLVRAAARREETLRKQLEAMKSIERGILEREDRMRTEAR